MKKKLFSFIFFYFSFLSFVFGIENNLFVGFGAGFGSALKTDFSQIITKDNNSCEGGVCIGGESFGRYKGHSSPTFRFIFGDEAVFDKLHISGLRIYGGIEVSQASLGSLEGKATTKAPRDENFQTITGDNNGTPIISSVNMLSPRTQQQFLLGNAVMTTFSLNLDFFANLPLDYFFSKKWANFPFMKLGVFAGFGVEVSLLKSNYWVNESFYGNQEDAFYASGNGLFLNLGGQLYLSKNDRLEVGVKIPYYYLKHTSWNSVNETTNIWAEQTLKQSFEIQKNLEIRVAYTFYF
ncbi:MULTISPECIES: outer membrane beta-barrel protein [unclassified Helicobacter]|uniref:outer membrane beta-barrel protein n=1 Tax=unclassified Helicobacter TaxID=2593540 RepID=UPI000CF0DE25|nr:MULTISPECIES: outer membrane beta-barrel protein [unclassified Helicobacter]